MGLLICHAGDPSHTTLADPGGKRSDPDAGFKDLTELFDVAEIRFQPLLYQSMAKLRKK